GYGPITPHHEAESASDAWPLEQGVDGDLVGPICRSLNVEVREIREFLGHPGDGRINCDAAGRNAVLIIGADGAEVRGAKEGDPIILPPVERLAIPPRMTKPALLKAEACKSGRLGQLPRRR